MKITISCSGGTLRVFHLASGLDRQGALHALYTPYYSRQYPYLKNIFGCPDDNQPINLHRAHSDLSAAFALKFIDKLKLDQRFGFEKRYVIWDFIDHRVARHLKKGTDVVFAESVMALHTFRRAKQLGAKTILDRPNCHIQYQKEIVEEEYRLMNMKRIYNAPEAIDKSIREYDEADYIAVLSSFVKRSFLAKGVPERKLLFLPSGVSLEGFTPVAKEDNKFRIIYCGLACIKKGLHYLLKALEELNLPESELWILGKVEEDFKPILAKFKGQYKAFGFVKHLELNRYYSQGSVFVLPSIEEGLAKVTMEAMACGLPVIATPNTGAEDVVRDGVDGFIVPIRSVQILKERILCLYQDKRLRTHMGQEGQKRVRQGFTFNDYVNRVQAAVEKING